MRQELGFIAYFVADKVQGVSGLGFPAIFFGWWQVDNIPYIYIEDIPSNELLRVYILVVF